MVKKIFNFNKNARRQAIKTFETLERSTLVGALVGAVTIDPIITAIAGLGVFVVCRIAIVVISGIEDVQEQGDKPPVARRAKTVPAARKRKETDGDGGNAA